ncbi:unnamed protein product, partial [Ectocarpus sp. 4 AP-2014]
MRSAHDRHLSRAYWLLLLCSCRATLVLRAALRWSKTRAQDSRFSRPTHRQKTPIFTPRSSRSGIAQDLTVHQPVNRPLSPMRESLLLPDVCMGLKMQASAEHLLHALLATRLSSPLQRPSAADDSSKSFNAVPGGLQPTTQRRETAQPIRPPLWSFFGKRPAASHRS